MESEDIMNRNLKIGLIIAMVFLLLFGYISYAKNNETVPQDHNSQEVITDTIPYWQEDSPAMKSIMDYVKSVTDPSSEAYIAPADRIVVFDSDGTLFGELFPTYFDTCLMIHRYLHDDTFQADPADKEYCQALEEAVINRQPEPDSPRSGAQMLAESFRGFTVDEYRQYIRDFMETDVPGFENMKYQDGFFKPMTGLIQYLAQNDFQIYIVSGTETTMLRELIKGTLDEYIPSDHVIGTSFTLTATNQGDTNGRSYTITADDEIIYEGNMTFKNQKSNKIYSIIERIGKEPILAFGNSSGDFAMGEYTLRNNGKAYMLLCDDTERDYGSIETAEKFRTQCNEYGFETVSMKNEFKTIYGETITKN